METCKSVPYGKPDAGNPHVRFDAGESHRRIRGVGLYSTKRVMLGLLSGLALFAAQADDYVLSVQTNLTDGASIAPTGDVYINNRLNIGNGGVVKVASGKKLYLPGAANLSVTVSVGRGATFTLAEPTTSQLYVGEKGPSGTINVIETNTSNPRCPDVDLGKMVIGGKAEANPDTGYIDVLRLASGWEASGHYRRVYSHGWYSFAHGKTVRVLFDVPQSTMAIKGGNNTYVVSGQYGTSSSTPDRWRFEGVNGANIVIAMGSWFDNGTQYNLVHPNVATPLTTAGDCDLVIHDHNANEAERVLVLPFGTNVFTWAHTGSTIISNSAAIKTSVDYALPNGPQTGVMRFRGSNRFATPALDLNGTTQRVNGLIGEVPVNGSVQNGCVTNSAEATAALVFGADGIDAELSKVTVASNVCVRKIGSGLLTIRGVTWDGADLEVTEGTVLVTNCASSVTLGTVTVSGGTLIIDGSLVNCVRAVTSGDGAIELRSGANVIGATSSAMNVRVSAADNAMTYAPSADEGLALSVEKEGAATLTIPDQGQTYSNVTVKAGTLRPAGTMVSATYWRYTFTEVIDAGSISVRLTHEDGTQDTKPTTIAARLALNRLSLIGASGNLVNNGVTYSGTGWVNLASGRSTCNMAYVQSAGFGESAGGVLQSPAVLHYPVQPSWFFGVVFTNAVGVSEDHPLVYKFRQTSANETKPAVGYLFARCVNTPVSRPYSWKVETSDDNENWTEVDARDQTDGANAGPDVYGNNGVPLLFAANKASWSFRPSGIVSVSAGATLDTAEIADANLSIARLAVDCSGETDGTITKFAPAANGTLYLTHAPADIQKLVLPLAVGTTVNADNLKTWRVVANNDVTTLHVRIKAGKLLAYRRSGVSIVFR